MFWMGKDMPWQCHVSSTLSSCNLHKANKCIVWIVNNRSSRKRPIPLNSRGYRHLTEVGISPLVNELPFEYYHPIEQFNWFITTAPLASNLTSQCGFTIAKFCIFHFHISSAEWMLTATNVKQFLWLFKWLSPNPSCCIACMEKTHAAS